ncbi:MAG TPA: AI-2E family transporter [Pseudomonadales bacterium]
MTDPDPRGSMHLRLERVFFFMLLGLATLAFVGLLRVFVIPIFWAVTFAIVFEPMNQRFALALGGRGALASSLSLLGIVLLILLPLLVLGLAVASELTALLDAIKTGAVDTGAPIRWFQQQVPTLFQYAGNFGLEVQNLRGRISEFSLEAGQWVASNALQIGQNTLQFFVGTSLMLYLLFFFLRDGHFVIERLVHILPLGDTRERHLFQRFAEVVRATVKGTFVIAAVQGAIGGIAFWALGIRGAVLWGVVMAGASLIPVVGAALVWVPAAVFLFSIGEIVKGLILVAVGVVGIGLVDNLLRPILVGRDTGMPDYLVLLATLGGLALFGITGLVIGPLIAALFITLWEMFEEAYGDREAERRGGDAMPSDARPPAEPSGRAADADGRPD